VPVPAGFSCAAQKIRFRHEDESDVDHHREIADDDATRWFRLSKMRPTTDGRSRFGIVFNGSPLFTGGAGSGESEIRRYVLENDLVETIITLPTDMFYNTGISTYVWVVSNRKPDARKGKLQLIDASSYWQKMRKSLGSKRKELGPEHIEEITQLFGNFKKVSVVAPFSTGQLAKT
jgi:type I restriction enzyme M protein